MIPESYAITFACHNQLAYTRQCIESMVRHGAEHSRIVAVNNASSDGTRDYLDSLPLGGAIHNRHNLGCGVAWNQGALALQAEWTIVMNDDVVASAGWLEGLIGGAQRAGLKVAATALIEGPLDYDFEAFAQDARTRMGHVVRRGAKHLGCVAIHQSVWEQVGYFRAMPRLWGYEDTLFFHDVDKAGIASGLVGSSWMHHFGAITMNAVKRAKGVDVKKGLSDRDSYKMLGESFLQRKLKKHRKLRQIERWREAELAEFGATLHGHRVDGHFVWE